MEQNKLFQEYEKFVGKEVAIKYHEGNLVKTEKGILKFLNFAYLTCLLETDVNYIIIKNVITISRKKKSDGEDKNANRRINSKTGSSKDSGQMD